MQVRTGTCLTDTSERSTVYAAPRQAKQEPVYLLSVDQIEYHVSQINVFDHHSYWNM